MTTDAYRERYRNDPAFRERERERSRKRYAARKQSSRVSDRLPSALPPRPPKPTGPCDTCGVNERYSKNRSRHCLPCRREKYRGRYAERERMRRRQRSTDPAYRASRARAQVLRKYKMTPEQFDAMLESQGGRCALCGTDNPGARNWNVDHDHWCCPGPTTCGNCVRGLLCAKCNMGIGFFDDDPDRLLTAATYATSKRNILAGR